MRVYFSNSVVPDELRSGAVLANRGVVYTVVAALGGTAIGLGKGCWVSVTGPRGAGKSTLAAAVAQYINLRLRADLGRVLWVDICGARSVDEVAHEVLCEMRRVLLRGEHNPVSWDCPDDALCAAVADCMRGGLLVLDDCDVAWRCHADVLAVLIGRLVSAGCRVLTTHTRESGLYISLPARPLASDYLARRSERIQSGGKRLAALDSKRSLPPQLTPETPWYTPSAAARAALHTAFWPDGDDSTAASVGSFESRTVALRGMGGVGKTQLAFRYAEAAERDGLYPGGVYWLCERTFDRDLQAALDTARVKLAADANTRERRAEQLAWHGAALAFGL